MAERHLHARSREVSTSNSPIPQESGIVQRLKKDVWLVAATNSDLEEAVRSHRFREDLYHRLAVLTFRLPPLRERGEDILLLAERFLAESAAGSGGGKRELSADARAALLDYSWPGNVRAEERDRAPRPPARRRGPDGARSWIARVLGRAGGARPGSADL
jgi:transcriptional regulator of acetoin/glycerol metabolism